MAKSRSYKNDQIIAELNVSFFIRYLGKPLEHHNLVPESLGSHDLHATQSVNLEDQYSVDASTEGFWDRLSAGQTLRILRNDLQFQLSTKGHRLVIQ